jgi:hypothetical protein
MIRNAMLALMHIAVFCLSARAEGSRLPVPDEQALAKATALAEEVYREQYTNAKNDEQKQSLAKKLLAKALEPQDPANHYVLLRLARDVAIQGGDGSDAFQAIDEMGAAFQVDLIKMKANALQSLSKKARLAPQHRSIVEKCLELMDLAVRGDDFATATRLADVALEASRKARQPDLGKAVLARKKEVDNMAAASERVKDSQAVLAKNGNDPTANLTVGRYYCLVKGDWEKGLPLLAKSDDPALNALAMMESKGAPLPTDQMTLGDKWWEQSNKEEGTLKERLQERSAYWYRKAILGLTGMDKDKVANRLGSLSIGGKAGFPNGERLAGPLLFRFDDKALLANYWEWNDALELGAEGGKAPKGPASYLRTRHAYAGKLTIDMDFSFGGATFVNTGGCWITIWGKDLRITLGSEALQVKAHITREGDQIVYVLNGKEQRISIAPEAWSQPTTVEVRWRSRTSHFRGIQIRGDVKVPLSDLDKPPAK